MSKQTPEKQDQKKESLVEALWVKPSDNGVAQPPTSEDGPLFTAPVIKEDAPEFNKNLPIQDRVGSFLSRKSAGDRIKLNDFLKSLYAFPDNRGVKPYELFGEPQKLKGILQGFINSGKILIEDNAHLRLGKNYYDSTDKDQRTKYHTLSTVTIVAVIL